jgi:hypothetical protein
MLNDVIRFKVHVQENIEGLDSFVLGELETELGQEAAGLDGEGEDAQRDEGRDE